MNPYHPTAKHFMYSTWNIAQEQTENAGGRGQVVTPPHQAQLSMALEQSSCSPQQHWGQTLPWWPWLQRAPNLYTFSLLWASLCGLKFAVLLQRQFSKSTNQPILPNNNKKKSVKTLSCLYTEIPTPILLKTYRSKQNTNIQLIHPRF